LSLNSSSGLDQRLELSKVRSRLLDPAGQSNELQAGFEDMIGLSIAGRTSWLATPTTLRLPSPASL
jgi:hypothetical protein